MDKESIIKVAIADDHKLFLSGLRLILEKNKSIEIVGEAFKGKELMELLDKKSVDVVVTDLSMPEANGYDVLDYVQKNHPKTSVVVLTVHKEAIYFEKAMRKGVLGYILKDDAYEKLLIAVENAHKGKKTYSDDIVESSMDKMQKQQTQTQRMNLLSQREREILELIANGLANKEVAERLDLSARTVESHRSNIMEKLELENYNELVRFALNVRIID